ncbi:MAG: hypothetical protein JWL78_830 [Chloroflexi bacterium]|jgi:hypothetical protein|nr:hypothetical protein [Chloroflexota bacterium]MEA2615169.1 hypothetical protein [Chloroflexota bacterium]
MNLKNISAAGAIALAALAAGTMPAFAATASETITGGGLTTTSPDITFASVAITGSPTSQSGSYKLDVNDLSGNNSGWKVTLAGAALTNLDTTTLVTTATPPGAAPCTTVVTGCTDLAANVSPTAPFAVSTTAVPLFSAAINTGQLDHNFTTGMSVAVPAAVSSGAYTSTWTVSVTSGP